MLPPYPHAFAWGRGVEVIYAVPCFPHIVLDSHSVLYGSHCLFLRLLRLTSRPLVSYQVTGTRRALIFYFKKHVPAAQLGPGEYPRSSFELFRCFVFHVVKGTHIEMEKATKQGRAPRPVTKATPDQRIKHNVPLGANRLRKLTWWQCPSHQSTNVECKTN